MKQIKKRIQARGYESPQAEIVFFDKEDVLTTSGDPVNGDNFIQDGWSNLFE